MNGGLLQLVAVEARIDLHLDTNFEAHRETTLNRVVMAVHKH